MMPAELTFRRRKRLPVVLASEAAECGLACITMLARYHGHDVDLNGLRQRFSLSLSGASLRSLMELADSLGLAPRPLRVDLEALDRIALPAILHWDLNHFVVLKAVGTRSVTVHDPALGARTLSLEEASRHFTGVALELSPTDAFQRQTTRVPVRLTSLWTQLDGGWSGLLVVLALSLALQVAVFVAPFQLQLVIDEAVFRADHDLLVVLALGFGALVVIQAGIEGLRNWALRVLGTLLSFQVVGNLVRHLLRLPSSYFEKRHVGDIVSRLGSVQPIQDAVTRGVIAAIIDGLMALAAAVILFLYSPLLACVVIAAVALNLLISVLVFPSMRAYMEEEIVAAAKEQTHLMESVRAATIIKVMGREAEREGAWRNLHAERINAGVAVGKLQISVAFVQNAIVGLQTVLVTFLAARMILSGAGFSVGMLYAFLSFRQTFTDRAIGLVNQAVQFRLLGLHLERLADIITQEPEPTPDHAVPIRVAGAIKVRDLSFSYGVADAPVLEGIDLDIAPGQLVAIVGPSGGGKSTLLKLLLGLQLPTAGTIELDGRKATPVLWRRWRERVGIVAQDDRLLSGSLADNIAFFDPNLDMPRVQAAAAAACVHEDIMRMPMQYLTLVGDMGSTLSGGQRQRVLLARALYRKPSVLFLDEGTANLDEHTEEEIARLVQDLPITRVVVAHRPALIRRADVVYRIDQRTLCLQREMLKHAG